MTDWRAEILGWPPGHLVEWSDLVDCQLRRRGLDRETVDPHTLAAIEHGLYVALRCRVPDDIEREPPLPN